MAQKEVNIQPQEYTAITRFCSVYGKELFALDLIFCSHCGSKLEDD